MNKLLLAYTHSWQQWRSPVGFKQMHGARTPFPWRFHQRLVVNSMQTGSGLHQKKPPLYSDCMDNSRIWCVVTALVGATRWSDSIPAILKLRNY